MARNSQNMANRLGSDTESDDEGLDSVSGGGSFFSEGADEVLTTSVCNNNSDNMSYNILADVPALGPPVSNSLPPKITIENQDDAPLGSVDGNVDGIIEGNTEDDSRKPPTGKSIAHYHIQAGNTVFFSFDVETGGDLCGIIQMLGQIFWTKNQGSNPETKSSADDIFNEYVKPPHGAFWSQNAINIHGITPDSPKIQNASSIEEVWGEFCSFINRRIKSNEIGILVAYNGETCDLKWLWKLTQAPTSTMIIPPKLKCFIDPLRVIKHYKSCPLHPEKTKLESSSLESIYKFVSGKDFEGAHDSLNDVKAQTVVVGSKLFVDFVDKTKSIKTISEIFSNREQYYNPVYSGTIRLCWELWWCRQERPR